MPPTRFSRQKSAEAKICFILHLCVINNLQFNFIGGGEYHRANFSPEGKGQARSGQCCADGAGVSRLASELGSGPTPGVWQPQTLPVSCTGPGHIEHQKGQRVQLIETHKK